MSDTLPTPVLNLVRNNGVINSSVDFYVAWRELNQEGNLYGQAKLYDATGAVVAFATSLRAGDPWVSMTVSAQSLNNPPYTVRVAAYDGTNTGPESPPAPLILYVPTVEELRYDTARVGVSLNSPPDGPVEYPCTLTLYKDGGYVSEQDFVGLDGDIELSGASATSAYFVAVNAFQLTPQGGAFVCTSIGPQSPQVGIITQPAILTLVEYKSAVQTFVVEAAPPTSVGPEVEEYAVEVRGVELGAARLKKNLPLGGGQLSAAALDTGEQFYAAAAGVNNSGPSKIIGPFSAALPVITQSPKFKQCLCKTTLKLLASWWPLADYPGDGLGYGVSLYRDGARVETKENLTATSHTFGQSLTAGQLFAATVRATAYAGVVVGPESERFPGPFLAESPTVTYDTLGRLNAITFSHYRRLTYAPDNFGNIQTVEISED